MGFARPQRITPSKLRRPGGRKFCTEVCVSETVVVPETVTDEVEFVMVYIGVRVFGARLRSINEVAAFFASDEPPTLKVPLIVTEDGVLVTFTVTGIVMTLVSRSRRTSSLSASNLCTLASLSSLAAFSASTSAASMST